MLVARISDVSCWQTAAPAASEPVKETETAAPTEAPNEETKTDEAKTEEKPTEKKPREIKVTRRLSTRITGLFKKEAKSKEDTPAVAEEAPKLDAVAPAAPLEEPKPEVSLYLLLMSFTRLFLGPAD